MKVAINCGVLQTNDEQGIVTRSVRDLIHHAANRHACKNGKRMFWDLFSPDKDEPMKTA